MLHFQNSFEAKGLWWLPDAPDETVPGTLNFDQENGPLLNLHGILGSIEDLMGSSKDRSVIHGITENGRPVTLLDCFQKSSRLNFPGLGTEVHRAHIVALGAHFKSSKEALFTASHFRFEGIERWLGQEPFKSETDPQSLGMSLATRSSKPEPLTTIEGQRIEVGANLRREERGDTEVALIVETVMLAIPDSSASLDWHFGNASRIQSLASICTGRHLPLQALQLRIPGKPHAQSVDILAQIQAADRKGNRLLDRPIVSAPELLNFNENALADWLVTVGKIGMVIDLMSAVLANAGTYVNVRFLLAAQAVEAFHRQTQPSPLVSGEAHSKIIGCLIHAIPPETDESLRKKLEGALAHTNEPNFRQRLTAMRRGIRQRFGKAPPGISDSFLHSVMATRNYYTHYDDELKAHVLDGEGMHWASRRIIALLTILLLERLGVPPTQIQTHLSRHNEFYQLWTKKGRPN